MKRPALLLVCLMAFSACSGTERRTTRKVGKISAAILIAGLTSGSDSSSSRSSDHCSKCHRHCCCCH